MTDSPGETCDMVNITILARYNKTCEACKSPEEIVFNVKMGPDIAIDGVNADIEFNVCMDCLWSLRKVMYELDDPAGK